MSEFTHHWKLTRNPSDAEWSHIKNLATALMTKCPVTTAKGMPLRGNVITYTTVRGIEKDIPVDHDNPALIDLTLDGVEAIQFNGAEPMACEAFSMPRCTDEQSVDTHARPYDDLVLGLFILIEDTFPDLLSVDSPAELSDWEAGLRAARCVDSTARLSTALVSLGSDKAVLADQQLHIDRPASLDFTR